MVQPYGKQCRDFFFIKIELSYVPSIPVLGVYWMKTKTLIQKDINALMFITALFIIAKIQKQLKCHQ